MDVSSVNLFLGLLAIAGWAAALLLVATLVVPSPVLRRLRGDVADVAPWLAFLVAAICTAGSLYYSEVADFTPCKLCWFQRTCMYPLVLLLGVAALRRDRGVRVYALPLAVIGGLVSAYHVQLQAFPDQSSGVCSIDAPCTAREVEQFGFLTIPMMAGTGFVLIVLLLLVGRRGTDRRGSPAAVPIAATPPAPWPTQRREPSQHPAQETAVP